MLAPEWGAGRVGSVGSTPGVSIRFGPNDELISLESLLLLHLGIVNLFVPNPSRQIAFTLIL